MLVCSHECRCPRRHQIPYKLSYSELEPTYVVLGTERRASQSSECFEPLSHPSHSAPYMETYILIYTKNFSIKGIIGRYKLKN